MFLLLFAGSEKAGKKVGRGRGERKEEGGGRREEGGGRREEGGGRREEGGRRKEEGGRRRRRMETSTYCLWRTLNYYYCFLCLSPFVLAPTSCLKQKINCDPFPPFLSLSTMYFLLFCQLFWSPVVAILSHICCVKEKQEVEERAGGREKNRAGYVAGESFWRSKTCCTWDTCRGGNTSCSG